MARRNWADAVEAHRDRPCRVCGRLPAQLAHVLPRKYDLRRGRGFYVDPLAVVRLCEPHHRQYDEQRLSLLPFLTEREVSYAVLRVGWGTAHRYIEGRSFLDQPDQPPRGVTNDG